MPPPALFVAESMADSDWNFRAYHPKKRTLSPTSLAGKLDKKQTRDGFGPLDMVPVR